jgi:hypothetical protein
MPRTDDKMKEDLQEIWTKFSKKGPRFDERDFDYFFSGVKNKGNNDEYVRQLKETFMEELSHKLHSEKGTNINTKSVDKFVGDLITHRLLTQLN